MCVIIQRNPGVILPEDKIWSASHVNPDGYGISFIDRGKIETIKEYPTGGNKPEIIMKRLADAPDLQAYVHFRFKTAGKTNTENCHPFQVLDKAKHGIDVMFMHNGTMHEFSGDKEFSDTYCFNEMILKPLLGNFQLGKKVDGSEESILQDTALYHILTKYAGGVFTLYDNEGHYMIVNKKNGVVFKDNNGKEWWASNAYSFNKSHRSGNSYGPYYSGSKGDADSYRQWWEDREGASWRNDANWEPPKKDAKGNPLGTSKQVYDSKGNVINSNSNVCQLEDKRGGRSTASSVKEGGKTEATGAISVRAKEQAPEVKVAVHNAVTTAKHVNPTLIPPSMRDTFVELAGITSLKQAMCLEQEDIQEIVENYPEAAVILIMDLLYELYVKDNEQKEREVRVG